MRIFSAIVCAALLAACSHDGITPVPSNASNGFVGSQYQQPLPDNGYKLVSSFDVDDGFPVSGLTDFNGALYGTTYGGGGQWGVVYRISSAGKGNILYSFKAGDDGAHPYAGLTVLNGMFYGTTAEGGAKGAGTVFRITPSGDEHVIYSFTGGSDGEYPYGALIVVGGELFGTTYQGGSTGSSGWGTIFKVSTAGREQVLYRFKAGSDGAHPVGGLASFDGALYGTTYQGGSKGAGTVFVFSSGAERILYSFKGGSDGEYPLAPLIAVNGEMYGTTYQGGISTGWGTVYEVSTTGVERVLYRFKAGNDGAHPQYGGLLSLDGALYGTTYQGGTAGAGTVFKVASGKDVVLYSFKGPPSDGEYPYAGLTLVDSTLFSTTQKGGASDAGTVFKLLP